MKNTFKLYSTTSQYFVWHNSKIRVEFKGSSKFKQDKVTFTLRNVVNLFVYERDAWPQNLKTVSTLKHCLIGAVKLPKNTASNKILILDMVLDLILIQVFNFLIFIGVKKAITFGVNNNH